VLGLREKLKLLPADESFSNFWEKFGVEELEELGGSEEREKNRGIERFFWGFLKFQEGHWA